MWNDLNMQQRADVISMAVKAGLRDIDSIRSFYDESIRSGREFAGGGNLYGFGDWLKKGWNAISNAVQVGAIAESPAVMTASGYRVNRGKAIQDRQNDKGVKQLRSNLADLGDGSIGAITGVKDAEAIYNIVKHPVRTGRQIQQLVESGVKNLDKIHKKYVPSKAMSKGPTKPKNITIENAKATTDKEWDIAYYDAISSNNIEEAQRLRDLHFTTKSDTKLADAKGMPIRQYHTVSDSYDPTFNEFDPTIEGTHSAIYTTDNYGMSRSYTSKLSKRQVEENKDLFINKYSEDYNKKLEYSGGASLLPDKQSYIISRLERLLQETEKVPRTKELYIKTNNPYHVEGNNSNWTGILVPKQEGMSLLDAYKQYNNSKIDIINDALKNYGLEPIPENVKGVYPISLDEAQLVDGDARIYNMFGERIPKGMTKEERRAISLEALQDIPEEKNPFAGTYSTRDIERFVRKAGIHDAVIIDDIRDYGGSGHIPLELLNEIKPGQVVESMNPNNLKYADAITKDDSGKIIPLSKRDNFNIGDLRYAISVPLIGGATYGLSNEKALGGPLVEEFLYRNGGSIHIKPSKRGTFTAAANKHGKSVQAFASQVLSNPETYSPAMRKKANFARNASKWKHN